MVSIIVTLDKPVGDRSFFREQEVKIRCGFTEQQIHNSLGVAYWAAGPHKNKHGNSKLEIFVNFHLKGPLCGLLGGQICPPQCTRT
jgi:hypothetical protein